MLLATAVKSVLLLQIQIVLFADHVLCQQKQNNSKQETGIPDTLGQDEGSGDVEPTMFNATVFPDVVKADTLPHLIVNDAYGRPCFLATLNATMQISYRVPEGIVHETYIALAEIQLPEDVHAHGVCGDNITQLILKWGNGTFHLNLTFTRIAKERENDTWSLTDLDISYDLSNSHIFPGTSETDIVTLQRHNLALFTTTVGYTHVCDQHIKIYVGTNERGVIVNFHETKIAAFGVTSSEYPSEVNMCTEDGESTDHEEILVPLIVACCLAVAVIIIVVAYVISRKIQTSRSQSDYKQMP